MLVAGHVVVGDEERRDALLVVLADDRFEIVGGAETALAALHVDDGAERALERAAAAEVEARHPALVARQRRRRQVRRRGASEVRQVVHVVVERLHRAVHRVAQHEVEAAFLGLAGEDRDAHVHGFLDLGRRYRQHRQAARHVEAADRHRQATQLQELAGEVDRVRELVGLDADQADESLAAAAFDLGQKPVGTDAGIGLVDRVDDDVDVGAQNFARAAILAQPVERGEGIGRNVRPQPSDRIAIIVVMSRLDQDQMKLRTLYGTAHRGLLQRQNPRAASSPLPLDGNHQHNALSRIATQRGATDIHRLRDAIRLLNLGFCKAEPGH